MENIFDDTEHAFAYKSNLELKKAYWLFKMMKFNWLISMGSGIILTAIRWKLPIKGILKSTLFEQFVGGETLEDATKAIKKLAQYKVDVILDYGAEAKEGEDNFDLAVQEFYKAIKYASTQPSIPFISLKITALARFELLEKLNPLVTITPQQIGIDSKSLSESEQNEWQRVMRRTLDICKTAQQFGVGVLIDAEETWIQDTIDLAVMLAMKEFNHKEVVVYNTIQLYRHDRLAFLKDSQKAAEQQGFVLAVKLVRGAYMEKERARAEERNEPSPIQPNKEATDKAFDEAVEFCLTNSSNISVVVATHNESSNLKAMKLIEKRPALRPSTFFSQLYGMSDNITFNLADHGYQVSKYLPYGTVQDVIPYLLRRAQENTSVAGQTGRELFLLHKEMERRKLI